MRSDHIEMSPGNPCQHCTAQGCAIYSDRPVEPCRNFRCGWLREPSPLPDDMRPEQTMRWLMNYVKETRTPLIFQVHLKKDGKYIGMKMMGAGPPAFIEDVRNAISPEDIFKL